MAAIDRGSAPAYRIRPLAREQQPTKPTIKSEMSRYQFSAAERYAVWTAHREKCWLCDGAVVSLGEMEVDHIIPEALAGTPQLAQIIADLGRPADFDLNSYENWMPAHPRCNLEKSDVVFEPTALIQARLQRAAERAEKARETEVWRDNLSEKSATIRMRCSGRGVGMIVAERQ
ncbi:MAG: HNH endonuclease [Methylocystis sp.]